MVYFLVVHWVRDPVQLRKQPLKISLVQSFSIAITRTGWGFKERPLPTTERKTSTDIERPANGGDQEKITTNNTAPPLRRSKSTTISSPRQSVLSFLETNTKSPIQNTPITTKNPTSNRVRPIKYHFYGTRITGTKSFPWLPSFSKAWLGFDLDVLGFNRVLPSFTEFFNGLIGFWLGSPGCYQVLPSFLGFYWVVTWFYRVLPSC